MWFNRRMVRRQTWLVRLDNWVLFNITSPILKVVYNMMITHIINHLPIMDTPRVFDDTGWAFTTHYPYSLSIYHNLKLDISRMQWWLFIIAWDAADVCHMYMDTRPHKRGRLYYAYRHSFRSGYGVRAFIAHYTSYTPYIPLEER